MEYFEELEDVDTVRFEEAKKPVDKKIKAKAEASKTPSSKRPF